MTLDVLYKPTAAAAEYSRGYAVNLYETCPHACRYCYNVGRYGKTAEDFHQAARRRRDILKRLEKDLVKIGSQPDPIFLCFGCDPFPMHVDRESEVWYSIYEQAVKLVRASGNRLRVLTKGYLNSDLCATMGKDAEIGVTLSTPWEGAQQLWEPEAACPAQRLLGLRNACGNAQLTWASFEPVINPDWTLELIERAAPYCDVFAIGCSNHLGNWDWPSPEEEARVRGIDWIKFLADARSLLAQVERFTYFKADLLRAAKATRLPGEFCSLDDAIDAAKERRIR